MSFTEALNAAAHSAYVWLFLILVAADLVTGVVAAVRMKAFAWAKFGNFLPKNALLGVAILLAQAIGKTQGQAVDTVVNVVSAAGYIAVLGNSISTNLKEITGRDVTAGVNSFTDWFLGHFAASKSSAPPTPTGGPGGVASKP